jgi:hypothetical protein
MFLKTMRHYIEAHNKKELGLIILENPPYANTKDATNKSNKKKRLLQG